MKKITFLFGDLEITVTTTGGVTIDKSSDSISTSISELSKVIRLAKRQHDKLKTKQ